MKYIFLILFTISGINPTFSDERLRSFINENSQYIIKSSSKTVDNILKKVDDFNEEAVAQFLTLWKNKKLYYIKKSKNIVLAKKADDNSYKVLDIFSNSLIKKFAKKDLKKIKPNSGVRAKISSALVRFQILSKDEEKRLNSIKALEKKILPEHLNLLRNALSFEQNIILRDRLQNLLYLAILEFSQNEVEKLKVLDKLSGNTSLEIRAAFSKVLRTSKIMVTDDLKKLKNKNVARIVIPEQTVNNKYGEAEPINILFNNKPEINILKAYEIAERNGYLKKRVSLENIKNILEKNIANGKVFGVDVIELNNYSKRIEIYNEFAIKNDKELYKTVTDLENDLSNFYFYTTYMEKSKKVTDKAIQILGSINLKVKFYKYLDLFIDGLSLASIYFLGAIGLAITFGVMRVINMAHGEFIMMGAYTGYVVQLYVSNHTLSLLIAFPLAFLITFLAGVVMERLVIRHLYKNPLDTLLATFGISIALQQLAKNIFGTQARPLTSPQWLDGAMTINDDLSISYIRIAIFILGLIFFSLLLFVMKKTRFGLETRSVTQNPAMAANMGINPEKINMLTFGFGSGIAGIAGVAIGLFSKVTSELGSEYIVQSFMTVVVGGVGSIWGTLAGASLIGFLQKIIEWFNPSNTLAAQTYMIIFIILFIQFRPRGLIALKGRAANDQ